MAPSEAMSRVLYDKPMTMTRRLARLLVAVAPDWAEAFVGDLLVWSMARRVGRQSVADDDPHEIAHLGSGIVVMDSAYCHDSACRMASFEVSHTPDGRAMLMPNKSFFEDSKRDRQLEADRGRRVRP